MCVEVVRGCALSSELSLIAGTGKCEQRGKQACVQV